MYSIDKFSIEMKVIDKFSKENASYRQVLYRNN